MTDFFYWENSHFSGGFATCLECGAFVACDIHSWLHDRPKPPDFMALHRQWHKEQERKLKNARHRHRY